MRAVVIDRWTDPRELQVREAPEPVLTAGHVLLEVRAAGCNFFDALEVAGKYQERPSFPFIPGAECAGVIRALGPDVEGFAVGDRVMCGLIRGAFAERVAVSASRLHKIPEAMSFEIAASISIVYATSLTALVDRAVLRAGESVLVTAAAGGVGLATVEIAKALGARVIGAVGNAAKADAVLAAGADAVVTYDTFDTEPGERAALTSRILERNDGRPIEVVIDCVGGSVFAAALKSVAFNGRLVIVGFASGEIPKIELNRVLLRNVSIVGLYLGAYKQHEPEALRRAEREVLAMWERGQIRPKIWKTFPLPRVNEALAEVVSRRSQGKVIVAITR